MSEVCSGEQTFAQSRTGLRTAALSACSLSVFVTAPNLHAVRGTRMSLVGPERRPSPCYFWQRSGRELCFTHAVKRPISSNCFRSFGRSSGSYVLSSGPNSDCWTSHTDSQMQSCWRSRNQHVCIWTKESIAGTFRTRADRWVSRRGRGQQSGFYLSTSSLFSLSNQETTHAHALTCGFPDKSGHFDLYLKHEE